MSVPRVVAHRGAWWPEPSLQNTPAAFKTALLRGWGVELDVWRAPGDYLLAVGHDEGNTYDLSHAIAALNEGTGPVLWNVKNAQCDEGLRLVAARHPKLWERSFVFDFDYRGTDPGISLRWAEGRYLWRDFTPTSRLANGRLYDGWWLDNRDLAPLLGDCVDATTLPNYWQRRFYVSPELHGRPLDLAFARRVLGAGAWLCTDVPGFFAALATEPGCEPVDPWWSA